MGPVSVLEWRLFLHEGSFLGDLGDGGLQCVDLQGSQNITVRMRRVIIWAR